MPAPNQKVKNVEDVLFKRVTRNSLLSKVSTNVCPKGKTTLHTVRNGPLSVKNENEQEGLTKRKARNSPLTDKVLKRPAFGDITNATEKESIGDGKKLIKKPVVAPVCSRFHKTLTKPVTITSKTVTVPSVSNKPAATTAARKPIGAVQLNKKTNDKTKESILEKTLFIKKKTVDIKEPIGVKRKPITVPQETSTSKTELKPKETNSVAVLPKRVTRQSIRLNDVNEISSGEESSLYVSALEDLNITEDKQPSIITKITPKPPPGVDDFDKENWDNPHQVSHYAMDIFNYLKTREVRYKIPEYMEKQVGLNVYMRALVVDWMVDVQENFELNHETLYLAVKIIDKFLSKVTVSKDNLQLVGATALFIASKYEEHSPPLLEDLVYIGDKSYTDKNVINMEINILKNLQFDLGFPLSYRFLRRYARCSKAQMELLTLARFILEYSLMEYTTVTLSDSKMAAAALHIARVMMKVGNWSTALEYYTGYKLSDIKEIAIHLNDIMHKKPRASLATIRTKYSDDLFFAVAKTPLVDNSEL